MYLIFWSAYLAKKVLDHLWGKTTFTAPATTYFALFTVMPTPTGGGTEVSGGSYARVAVTNNTTNWPNATGSGPASKSNGTAITFPTPSADWGTVVGVGELDASTAGNLLRAGQLTTQQVIHNGDAAPSFAIGEFSNALI